MASTLQSALKRHMADDTLIKGWEVARRTCNGRERGPLRKASREVNAIRNSVLEGRASERTRNEYVTAIENLYTELAKAGEQDFDGMLGEALGWLEAQESGQLERRLPVPAALTPAQIATLEQIRDYRFINSPGHIGRAIDRDLRLATEIAKEVRAGLAAMAAASSPGDLLAATSTYVDAAARFCTELGRAGEPDFDGILRQAVLILDSAPNVANKAKSASTQEAKSSKGARDAGKGGKAGKSSGKGIKGGGGYGGGKYGGGKGYGGGNNWVADYHGRHDEAVRPSEPRTRRWKAKDPIVPDEALWGA